MEYLNEFLIVALAHLLAVVSPGPDFAIVTRNSLSYSRAVGIATALGVGLGISVHVTYSIVGIGLIIANSIVLFNVIKLLGAGYLIWLGIQALRSQPHEMENRIRTSRNPLSLRGAFWMGFATNVLNPKATLFFLALFTQVIRPETPHLIQGLYGLEMMLVTGLWFTVVASLFSHRILKDRLLAVSHWLDRAFGTVLIALGLKIALTRD